MRDRSPRLYLYVSVIGAGSQRLVIRGVALWDGKLGGYERDCDVIEIFWYNDVVLIFVEDALEMELLCFIHALTKQKSFAIKAGTIQASQLNEVIRYKLQTGNTFFHSLSLLTN